MNEKRARQYLLEVRKGVGVPEGDPNVTENIRYVQARLRERDEDATVTSKWLLVAMRVFGAATDEELLLFLEHYDSKTGRPW